MNREIVTKENPTSFEKILQWIGNRNWYIVAGIIFLVTLFEIYEITRKHDSLTDPFHLAELAFYIVILILVGVLFRFLVQAHAVQARTMQILEHKHNLSLRLTELENWDALTGELVRLPSTIATVEESQLFIRNAISGEMETVAYWNEDGTQSPNPYRDCRMCLREHPDTKYLFSSCAENEITSDGPGKSQEFCLPINYSNRILAIIQFKLKDGKTLSQNQMEIFENTGPEMALALMASQERKRLDDMRAAEITLAERHSVSTYLHDHLSQNLAYLCLKLEQLSKDGEYLPKEYKQVDLRHMMEAANQSYEILRDMIETIHPETTPRLVNLIKEHAKKVSERAHFEALIEITGKEWSIPSDTQKAIFYVFQEALSNVEKHARAKSVKVFIHWDKDCLEVTVADDGIGFNLKKLEGSKHIGLEIMRERIDKVGGQIDVRSSVGSGTEIKISVPMLSLREDGVDVKKG